MAIPNGATETFEVTFAPAATTDDLGLVVLLVGATNCGACRTALQVAGKPGSSTPAPQIGGHWLRENHPTSGANMRIHVPVSIRMPITTSTPPPSRSRARP